MAQYVDPLIRSGAMRSCERQSAVRPQSGLWLRIWRWLGVSRPAAPRPIVFRSSLLRPGRPRY